MKNSYEVSELKKQYRIIKQQIWNMRVKNQEQEIGKIIFPLNAIDLLIESRDKLERAIEILES